MRARWHQRGRNASTGLGASLQGPAQVVASQGRARQPAADLATRRARYWFQVRCWTVGLLVIWLAVAFVVPYFARQLQEHFAGWPLSYWMGAQGALFVFLALVMFYAGLTSRLARKLGLDDEL